MREGKGFAIGILERRMSSRREGFIPPWREEARELMNSIRGGLSKDKARWREENADRREEVRQFMAQLRAEFRHERPGDELPEMVEVDCGYCGGQGSLPRTVKCPVCWGKGKVRVRAPYEKCDL